MIHKLEPLKSWKLGDDKKDVGNKFQSYPTDAQILQNF